MGLAEAAAVAELGPARPLLQRLLVELDRGRPVPLPLQVEGPLEHGIRVARGRGRGLRSR